jgi:hypothetical protein
VRYQYLRISVIPEELPPILEAAGAIPPRLERTHYLLRAFGERVDFIHRKTPFVYIPIGEQKRDGGIVQLGRIGRSLRSIVNEPPEADFAETEIVNWRAANILIDTRDNADGQKAAFQCLDVGQPFPILTSLVEI